MNKRILVMLLIFSCLFSAGCNTKEHNNTEEVKNNFEDIGDFNIVEEADEMHPENYADYIKKCAKYYYDYIDVGDYTNITYSIRRNASDTDDSYADKKFDAIYEVISNNSDIKSYPKDIYEYLISTLGKNINDEYKQYKEENQSFIGYLHDEYGFNSIDDFDTWSESYVQNYLEQMMIIYIIAFENKITINEEDIKNEGDKQAEIYNYSGYEEIISQYGNEMNTELGYQVLYQHVKDFLISIATNE